MVHGGSFLRSQPLFHMFYTHTCTFQSLAALCGVLFSSLLAPISTRVIFTLHFKTMQCRTCASNQDEILLKHGQLSPKPVNSEIVCNWNTRAQEVKMPFNTNIHNILNTIIQYNTNIYSTYTYTYFRAFCPKQTDAMNS